MKQPLKFLLVALLFGSFGSVYAQQNDTIINVLSKDVVELELHYVVWGCACPNWVTTNDFSLYENNGLIDHCMYLEEGAGKLALPDDFDPSADILKVKGQYYLKKGYPEGFVITEENEKAATVFRFTEYEVVKHKKENESGLQFSFTATETDGALQVRGEVLNTTGRDICFLTSTCAGYQDALLYSEDKLEMLKLYCNISRPVIRKIEPNKSYSFNVRFTKKGELTELKLGFEMEITDNMLFDKTLDWDNYKNIEGKKVVLWNTAHVETGN